MSVFIKDMEMPMCCAECRFLVYANFEDFVECSALVEFMIKDKMPEGRREDCPLVDWRKEE